jgi:uncharacterized membrane protein (UPF0127 family)
MRLRRPVPLLAVLVAAQLAALAAFAGAPAAQAAPAAAGSPQTGLRIGPVRIETSSGAVHHYRAEFAETPRQQAIGMMFRRHVARSSGMLFLFPAPEYATFYMRNTFVPLDIIFIGVDRRVLNIAHGRPRDETILPSAGLAAAVLELKGGEAARIGLQPGDRVLW